MASEAAQPDKGAAADSLRALALERNRGSILAFEFMWGVAMPIVHYSTVLAGYLAGLGVDKAWIGLLPAVHNGVLAVVQPLSAYAIQPGPRRVIQMRYTYAVGALGYVILGLLVLCGMRSAAAGLIVALLAELAFAISTGFGDPHYMALNVDAVAPHQRGRFFGIRCVCLGIGGILGGQIAGWALQSGQAPLNFGLSILLGGLAFIVSTYAMLFYRERPAAPPPPRGGFGAFLTDRILPHLRRRDFRYYILATILFTIAASVVPFLGLFLKQRLQETDRFFGVLGSLFMGSNLVMSWLLGAACDRWGSRVGLALAIGVFIVGLAGCLLFHDRTALLVSYLLVSIWLPGQLVAATDLLLRLAAESPASEVTATYMLTLAPARTLAPILIGFALDRLADPAVIIACGVLAFGALVALLPCSGIRIRR